MLSLYIFKFKVVVGSVIVYKRSDLSLIWTIKIYLLICFNKKEYFQCNNKLDTSKLWTCKYFPLSLLYLCSLLLYVMFFIVFQISCASILRDAIVRFNSYLRWQHLFISMLLVDNPSSNLTCCTCKTSTSPLALPDVKTTLFYKRKKN